MSERWVQRSERVLKRLRDMEATEDMDRLELVRSIRFVLGSLWNSLSGWMQWIANTDVMTKFSQEELEEMNRRISEFVKSFIEYDIEITKEGIQKGIAERRETRPQRERIVRRAPDRLVI